MTKGNTTSRVFRIVVKGSPLLLKLILRSDDPSRHYANMRAAAEAGLAPRVWYTNVEDRVSITDFVDTVPLPAADALIRIPATLRAVHALPPFAPVPNRINTTCMFLLNDSPERDAFLERIRAAKLLPPAETEELFMRYQELAAVYPRRQSDMASSHNDLFKPDNVLFDGDRVWLVDWEAAFWNDRYADLAAIANMIVTNSADEAAFLKEYFGAPPNDYQSARLFLAQQVAHTFYAMVYLLLGSADEPIDWSRPGPDTRDFGRRFWDGEIDLTDKQAKILYGRQHWQQLLDATSGPRYTEARRIVASRGAAD